MTHGRLRSRETGYCFWSRTLQLHVLRKQPGCAMQPPARPGSPELPGCQVRGVISTKRVCRLLSTTKCLPGVSRDCTPESRPHCSVDSREWKAHPGAVVSSAELGPECPSTERVRNSTVTQSPAVVGSEGEHRTLERDPPPFHAAASSGASRSQDGQWLAGRGVHGDMSSLRDRGVAARGQRSAEKTARESRGPQLPAAAEGGRAAPQRPHSPTGAGSTCGGQKEGLKSHRCTAGKGVPSPPGSPAQPPGSATQGLAVPALCTWAI